MKRNSILVGIGCVVSAAVVGWLIFDWLPDRAERQRVESLSEQVVERRLQLYNAVITRSCECGTERDGGGDEELEQCLEDGLVSASQIESMSRCFRASAEKVDVGPPQGVEKYQYCARAELFGVENCLRDVDQYERCSMEALEQIRQCMFDLVAMHCEEIDDDTESWLKKLGEAVEAAGCGDEIAEGLDAGRIAGGLQQREVDLEELYERWPRIEVGYDAISVDGQPVMGLTEGELPADNPQYEHLEPILEAYDDHENVTDVQVRVKPLVSYATTTHVLHTVTGGLEAWADIDVQAPPYSEALRRQFDAVDSLGDAGVGDADVEQQEAAEDESQESQPLDLAITTSADGFYVSAVGRMWEPIDDCDAEGPTVCLRDDDVDTIEMFQRARQAAAQGDEQQAAQYLDRGIDAYDFRRLYNLLVHLHQEYPQETVVRLNADMALPMGLVDRVIDTAAYRLEKFEYEDDDRFRQAFEQGPATDVMFVDAAFAIHM